MPFEKRGVYRDRDIPLNAQELHNKRLNAWMKLGMTRPKSCENCPTWGARYVQGHFYCQACFFTTITS
jgi:hypothetical protein